MSTPQSVNLARKLRPKTFEQIVGQGISVKILQNSLYLKKYFPVYLFSGQRGCGKTTTARVFASAVNCLQLPVFQQDPAKQTMPCLTCLSCNAMAEGSHPDFIEIDAASHTGVDHVRQIIDSAAYVPLLGQKKIYLIDEAHMLSKAAFNAFLKILEEPPQTVLFILATTERNKIPETVLSRCFQLSFTAVEQVTLAEYLSSVCQAEGITIDQQALSLVIEETEGSVRDALNVLEQLRFSNEIISQEVIVALLGKVSNALMIKIFNAIVAQQYQELLTMVKDCLSNGVSPILVWESFVELLRGLLWIKHGVTTIPNQYARNSAELKDVVQQFESKKLHMMLSVLWEHELLFIQTTQKAIFIEMILLHLAERISSNESNNFSVGTSSGRQSVKKPAVSSFAAPKNSEQQTPKETAPVAVPVSDNTVSLVPTQDMSEWQTVVEKILQKNQDAFLFAILKQAIVTGFDQKVGLLTLQLSNNGTFFKDKVTESIASCSMILKEAYPGFIGINFSEVETVPPVSKAVAIAQPTHENTSSSIPKKQSFNKEKSNDPSMRTLNVEENKEQWPSANMMLSHFPGVIKIEE